MNDILTYTTVRNQDYTAENSTQAFQLAFTGVKQKSHNFFLLLPLPVPLKKVIQVVSPKQRLSKVFSNTESLVRWQRSTQETHHTHWAETSSEPTDPKQHKGLPSHHWPLPPRQFHTSQPVVKLAKRQVLAKHKLMEGQILKDRRRM